MNKTIQSLATKQGFSDFTSKLTAKWRLRTLPNTSPASKTAPSQTEAILRDLVAMPTVVGNDSAFHEALNYIDQFLEKRGMHVKRLKWNGVEALVATTKRTKKPIIYLAGHIDVVPGEDHLFKLEKRDEKYYGRGVLDMKGAIAAYLGAVEELGDSLKNYDFGIMIMTDEEQGGFDGAANLAKEGYISQAMVLPDGGSNWNIERFAKGIWHITIQATGKSAHGSRPWEGENAVDKLMEVIYDIKQLFPKEQTPESSTINLGIVQGGEAINQIPSSATASMDIRYASEKDQAKLTTKIKQVLNKHGVKIVAQIQGDATINDPANEYLAAYAACTEKAVGHPVEWITSNAQSDARWFVSKGTHCAIAYPRGGGHHGADEWIGEEALYQMQSIFVDYIQSVAKKPSAR